MLLLLSPCFLCYVCYAFTWICLLLLLRLLCLCLGSVIRFHCCKLLRITWSIVDGKLTNLRRLKTIFFLLCLLCLCLSSSVSSATSAMPVPGFVYFFCYVRCACAWVCPLLLLRPPCLYLGSTAFTVVSCSELPDLSLTKNWRISDDWKSCFCCCCLAFFAVSAVFVPGFFCCACAWVCLLLLPMSRSFALSATSAMPLPNLCLCLGLPPSLLCLLCICLVLAYVWVFHLLCCVRCGFVRFFCWATRPLCACFSVG